MCHTSARSCFFEVSKKSDLHFYLFPSCRCSYTTVKRRLQMLYTNDLFMLKGKRSSPVEVLLSTMQKCCRSDHFSQEFTDGPLHLSLVRCSATCFTPWEPKTKQKHRTALRWKRLHPLRLLKCRSVPRPQNVAALAED